MTKYWRIAQDISVVLMFSGDVAWQLVAEQSMEMIEAVCGYYKDHPEKLAAWRSIRLPTSGAIATPPATSILLPQQPPTQLNYNESPVINVAESRSLADMVADDNKDIILIADCRIYPKAIKELIVGEEVNDEVLFLQTLLDYLLTKVDCQFLDGSSPHPARRQVVLFSVLLLHEVEKWE